METNAVVQTALGDTTLTALPPETVHRSKEQQVADILRGAEKPPQQPERVATSESVAETPLRLKDLAERLQVKPEKLYELEFPVPDGADVKHIKLSEIKDRFGDLAKLDVERKGYREERGKWEADRIAFNREASALIAAIPPQFLTPQTLEQAKRAVEESRGREVEATLRRFPEWSDAIAKEADMQLMVPVAKAHGWSDFDIEMARKGFADVKTLSVVRELAMLKAELAAIKAKLPAAKGNQAPQRRNEATPAQDFGRIKSAVTSKQISKEEAVRRILRGNRA